MPGRHYVPKGAPRNWPGQVTMTGASGMSVVSRAALAGRILLAATSSLLASTVGGTVWQGSAVFSGQSSLQIGGYWAPHDGSLNAPTASAGTQQYPTLLNNYAPAGSRVRTDLPVRDSLALGNRQPPWKVAGVDYPVGIDASRFPLKDPGVNCATLLAQVPGTSFPAGGNYVVITANNVTIDGWDFTLHNGYGIKANTGVSGAVIQHNKFLTGSNLTTALDCETGVTNFTFQYNFCDGNAPNFTSGNDAMVIIEGTGHLIQYNYFTRIVNDCCRCPTTYSGSRHSSGTIQFNLIDSINTGAQHSDFNQIAPNNNTAFVLTIDFYEMRFNTYYLLPSWSFAGGGGNNSFVLSSNISDSGAGSMGNSVDVQFNSMIVPSGLSVVATGLTIYGGSPPTPGQFVNISNNYIDPTNMQFGAAGAIIDNGDSGQGAASDRPITYNNINMVTGAFIVNENIGAIPSVPTITSATPSGSTVALAGTAPGVANGSTVFIIDPDNFNLWPAPLYGTTTVTGAAWSFTTGALSGGLHRFKVVVVDANIRGNGRESAITAATV